MNEQIYYSRELSEQKRTELLCELEQSRYQLVIDEMKAAVFEWDLQTGAFYSSENYRDYSISDAAPEQVIQNKAPVDAIHPDDIQALMKFFADTKSGQPRAEATVRLKLRSGGYRWCRMIGLFYKDECGQPTRTLGIIIDISEEKEQSFMLDSLVNELPGGVAVFKVGKTLDCQYFNDGFAKLLGRRRAVLEKAFLNNSFADSIIAAPDLPRFKKEIRELAATGKSINITFRFQAADSELRWMHMNASKLREEDGCSVYYCVFTTPSEETALYRSIVEDSTTGVLVAEREPRRIVYCNERLKRIYHVEPETPIVGRLVYDVIPWRRALLSNAEVRALSRDHIAEYHRQYGDCYFGIRAKALTWNGADCYVMYVSDETQEHKKRMQQKELLNLVPMGIGICEIYNNTLRQVYMNDSYYRMIGEEREKRQNIEQSSILNYVHEDDLANIRAVVDRCTNGSNEQTVDYRIYCGDGIYRWFRMAVSVVKREKGRITLYCGYANINDTITAQEALKKANTEIQKQYGQELSQRKMLENDSMVAVQFNVTQDKLISYRVCQGLVKEYDSGTGGSLIRPDISENIPTEEERRIAADFFDVPKAIERFKNGIKEFSAEYRRRLNDGRLYWLQSTCRLAMDEESGDVISYTYLRNIDTERKKEQTAESVIDNETDFVILLNTVSDTAMLLRLRDNYSNISQELYKEFPFHDIIHSDKFGAVEPEDRQEVMAFFQNGKLLERLKLEPVATITYRYRYNDGVVRLKKTRAFYLDGTHEDIVIARRDITDIYEEEQAQQRVLQRALEEAKSASRAKSDFLSRMSHDLRTPMNVIIGLTSMAMDRPDKTREMEEMLSNITSSAKYLLSLINDCLDLEKITSGKIELHPVPYTYEEFYDNAQAVIGPLCRQNGITLSLADRNEKHTVILADKMRMEQIFYNLMSNAVKFTPSGGKIEFLLRDSAVHGAFNSFTCVIRDTGIGMSDEFQQHMFEAFAQETNTVTPEYQGSGLGLAIVKQLVDLMDAEISVKSKLGEGTEFTLRFCFPLVQSYSKTEREKANRFTPGQLSGKRILLAEDHPLNSMIAVKLLEKMDMTVTTAVNGQEAVDIFSSKAEGYYDAILMDIRMPVMNGLEAARTIRAIDSSDAKTIPIIAMTANAFEADIEESLRAGMDAHLSKPIEAAKLYEALAEHIK